MVDLLLLNGNIHTLSPSLPRCEALAVQNGVIVAAGSQDELRHLSTRRTVNLEGRTVMPGLTDGHIHWEWTSLNLRRVSLFDLPTREACLQEVAKLAARLPEGSWIVGFGWAQGPWTDTGGAFPTAADLDRVVPRHPVFLASRSGHAGWCNSLALQQAGLTEASPDPPRGALQRDSSGRLTGILLEEAITLVRRVIPTPSIEEIADRMSEAQELAWQCGLTGLHDYDHSSCFAALQVLHERGRLGLRVLKQINDPVIHHAHALGVRTGFGNDWLRLGSLKIFADGALGAETALMIEPYNGQPGNRGMVVCPKDRMRELVLEATRQGVASTIHAIGDQAVRDVLDVLGDARRVESELGIPRWTRRHRIEHVQVIHPADVARLAALDVIGSFQPIHATSDYPVADRLWGDRCALAYNPRVQLDLGARVVFGSDSPVESFDPFAGIHAAVTRRRPDGSPGQEGWYPEARLSLTEAVMGYTTGAAWAAGAELQLGRLDVGFLADLIVLDRDPWELQDPMELLEVRVESTMVGGEWRWRRGTT
jgi:predicted amidohydrolase YtcJ